MIIVSLIKTTFTYSPARKRRWISFLSANGILNPLLPPLPVKTRWNSWYNFVFWLNKHFNFFIEFYQEEKKNRNSNSAILELIKIFKDSNNIFFLQYIMHFITFNMQH